MKQEYNIESLGTRGVKRGNRKWDTAKIEALYMAGAELGDILKTPEFEKMSKNYLKNLMVQGKWIAKRIKLREEVANTLAPKMEDVMRTETENSKSGDNDAMDTDIHESSSSSTKRDNESTGSLVDPGMCTTVTMLR